jgi:hypothetical protein
VSIVAAYSVYEPPKEAPDLFERADKLAFVKEGFSWPALVVPLLWLIYHRMWIEFILLLVVYVALQAAFGTEPQGQAIATWASLAVGVLFAFEANDLRTLALERRGYRFAGVAIGRDRTEAERTFFSSWLPHQQTRAAKPEREPATGHESKPVAPVRGGGEEVIGLFPRP